MRLSLVSAVALSAVLAACGRPPADLDPIVTSISGRVLDAATQQPVANALIATEPFVKQAFTGADGLYTIENGLTIGGTYRVTATKSGYETNAVNITNIIEGENTVADILVAKAGPKLHLSTTSVQIGKTENAGTFRIENSGDQAQALSFQVSKTASWITSVSPDSGSVTSQPKVVTVTIDRLNLPADDVPTAVLDVTAGTAAQVEIRVLK